MEPDRATGPDTVLSGCDREPIHVPGAVQAHGGLLALEPDDGRVVYRSANLAALLGLGAEPLGARVDELLGDGTRERFVAATAGPPQVDPMPMRLSLPGDAAMDATAHRSGPLVVAEFEPPDPDPDRLLIHEARLAVLRIEAATGVEQACSVAVDEVRRLTGYDRVMIYRFHDDEHGEVVAEARRSDSDSWLGLHYPASDIPRSARRLLRLSPTRLITDIDASTVPIAGLGAYAERPLDLSRSALRAVSPIHLQYLRNMGVAASLTISLADGPRLWGLLACHHQVPVRPSPELRAACVIVARTLWQSIDAWERRDRDAQLQERMSLHARFLATVSGVASLADALVEDGNALLDLVAADGVTVRIDDVTASVGATPSREAIAAIVQRLDGSEDATAIVTDETGARFPELGLDPAVAAGLLAMRVADDWHEHVIWFRGETQRPRTWAGDPTKSVIAGPLAGGGEPSEAPVLSPRSSFAAWRETLRGRGTAWSPSDVSAAANLVAALPGLRSARTRDALATLALRDSLTGLPNRALLLDRLEMALTDLQRTRRRIWLLFIDLDGFKEVNDGLGHLAGDEVLVTVGARLRGGVRGSDTVARLGGDEFVILCPEDATDAAIEEVASRLLQLVAAPIAVQDETCIVTASIGIAAADKTAVPATVLRAADTAMYRAKQQGRSRLSW